MSPIDFKDYYGVLGVDRSADAQAIKSAFRKRARELHPDVNTQDPKAEEKFKELNEAYEVLSDAEKRERYDTFGKDWERYQHTEPNPGGATFQQGVPQDFEAWFSGDGSFEYRERSNGFSDFFNLIFGNRARGGATSGFATAARRGEDLEVPTSVSLREAMTGTSRTVNVRSPEACGTCGGTGLARGVECPTCDGTGTVLKSKKLEVRIPAGVQTGKKVRVSGQGGPGSGGGPNGDVYLNITVAPDDRFEVRNRDLVTRAEVPLYTALLGGEVVVNTVESHVALTIPAGTQNGRIFKLRGKGLPVLGSKSGERGDLLVQTEVVLPDSLSDRERELFTELQSLRQ